MGTRKNCDAARMALVILRQSLLWARKGRVFKRRLMLDIHLVSDYLRRIRHKHTSKATSVDYKEEQFSFDSTPVIHVKMYRPHSSIRFKLPHFPCLEPEVLDFQDYKFDHGESGDSECGARISFFEGLDEDDHHHHGWEVCDHHDNIVPYEESIDERAEEFISRFYNQIKLQRQDVVFSNTIRSNPTVHTPNL